MKCREYHRFTLVILVHSSNTSNNLYPLLAELFVSPVLYNGLPRKLSVTISMYSWGGKKQKMAIMRKSLFHFQTNSCLYQKKNAQDTVDLKLNKKDFRLEICAFWSYFIWPRSVTSAVTIFGHFIRRSFTYLTIFNVSLLAKVGFLF